MATVSPSATYTVQSGTGVTVSAAYTVLDRTQQLVQVSADYTVQSSTTYPIQKRVDSGPLPVQFGHVNLAGVIEWLTPDLP